MKQLLSPKLKPFVKWVGGKTQFLEIIDLLLPFSYNRIIEPFVGGGAVFLNLQPSQLIINDVNNELITTYKIVKENPQELLKILLKYEENHSKIFFNKLRNKEPKNLNNLEVAARFIYLNKTGFNGLYRVNSQGIFNVSFGQKNKIKLVNKDNILNINKYLNTINCQIFNQDYQKILSLIKEGDFLFVDPPYDVNNINGFTKYTASGFNQENQKQLYQFLKQVEIKGARWLLTNHNTDFIKNLYQSYQQFAKKAYRYINCQGNKRVGNIQEIFIWNYELTTKQKELLEFEKWFDTIQITNTNLNQLVNWSKVNSNLLIYEKNLIVLNFLICDNLEQLRERINQIWKENPISFQILPYLLAVRDNKNFSWLENSNIEYWENLSCEKVNKLIFESNLAIYLTNGKIKNLKDYCLGLEVGLGTHGRKNVGGQIMEKTVENLLNKYQIEYHKQILVNFQINSKKIFDFQIKLNNKKYYLETSFFNVSGSKVSEVIRSYQEVLNKTNNNKINFIWILDGKGLKSVKKIIQEIYLINKQFMFTLNSFEKLLKSAKNSFC